LCFLTWSPLPLRERVRERGRLAILPKQILLLTILILFISLSAHATITASKKCGSHTIRLKSHATHYDDFLTLEKIKKTGGWDGLWKMTDYRQVIRFMGPVPIQKTTIDTHQLGDGMWMKVQSVISKMQATTKMLDGHVLFEIKNGKIGYSKTNQWLGEISADGKASLRWSTVPNPHANPLTGQGTLDGGETIKIEIINPSANEKFAFDGGTPGKFFVDTIAQVTPATYKNQLTWYAETIQGTDISVSGTGTNVRITYKKLPADNSSFGPHKIVAKLDVDGCEIEAKLPIKVFYLRDEKNNPAGQHPNWFYYWKQTPAAKPQGQTINILFGGSEFHECANLSTIALFRPGFAYKSIHICDLKKLGNKFTNNMPLLDHNATPPMLGWQKTHGIDTYATVVLHEHMHMKAWHNWRKGKNAAQIAQTDKDDDGIPDTHEVDALNFDPQKKQTYMATHPKLKNIGYDEEWLCFEDMRQHELGKYNDVDWSYPGKQWSY